MNKFLMIVSCTSILASVCCTGNLNQVDGVMGTSPDSIPALVANPPSSIYQIEEPTVQGLDRRNWGVVAVEVPRGQVEVQPTYSENIEFSTCVDRNNGSYPTVQTAFQGNAAPTSILMEGIIEPFWPVALFIAAPVRMVRGEWPMQTKREPKTTFELVPASDSTPMSVRPLQNWTWVENPKQP